MVYKIYFGKGMSLFGRQAVKNLGFEQYDSFSDIYRPVLFLGLYDDVDYQVFKDHRGRKAIFWNGSDVSALSENVLWQATIKTFPNVRHACHNLVLQKELESMEIEAKISPIFFSGVENYTVSFEKSDVLNVYMTAHPGREVEYGVNVVEEIADQTSGILFHVYGISKPNTPKIIYHGEVPEEQMDEEIKKFQVCLRLNKHDGLSQTLLKSVLLGQYQISAIEYPYISKCENAEDIVSKLNEFKLSAFPNREGRGYYTNFVNNFEWLKHRENDIALVMAVKNEGKGLEKAILSCIEFVDEIVISVDSKSSDDTLEIAKKYADVVKIHEWENDFSKARNFAQEGVETKWILCIDGHEYVESFDGLAEKLKSNVDGLLPKIVMETGFSFFFPRIYKSHLQWFGAVHNSLPVESQETFKSFVIKHDRANLQAPFAIAQRSKQRDEMILSIMGERVKKDKRDTRALFYLGIYYLNGKDLYKAIDYFKKYLKYAVAKGERYSAWFNIAFCYYTLKRYTKALKFLSKAEKEESQRWETVKFAGMCYMGFERWDKALVCLVESFKEHSRDFYYNPWPVDFGDTWNMISISFLAKGEYQKSKQSAEEALKKLQHPEMKSEIESRLKLLDRIMELEK